MFEALTLHAIPPEDEALRAPVRAFLDEALAGMPLEQRARSWSGHDTAFSRKLAERGWVGLHLPQAWGGGGRGPFARFVLLEELLRAGAPVAAHWIAERQSAPLILKFGTPEQARRHVPAICRGEQFFCIGMSEPGSGSDLASVRTRAVRRDGRWRLSGQKIWTTNAHRSHFMIALVRTGAEAGEGRGRHAGLSQFIVDLSRPGITVRPIEDLNGEQHFCEVFFDEVELGDDALVGAEGEGWKQVTAELAYERSGPERIYASVVLMDRWLQHQRTQGRASERTLELAGRMLAQLAVLRQMSLALHGALARGDSPATEAALVKDLGTGFEQWLPEVIADALGDDPDAPVPEELARTLRYLTQIAPSFSLRGGTREVLRGMIARGLALR